jgi:hypothetical protein
VHAGDGLSDNLCDTGLWTTMLRSGRPLAKTLTSARAVLRMHPILPAIGREEALARRKDEVKRHKASSYGESDLLIYV